jgi:CheY-like chemotaxis protein
MAEKKILIVDDDADYRASLTAVLENQGYAVVTAASAKEGLGKVVSERPDLVVLDVMMEHASAGYEVNEAIKFQNEFRAVHDVPILMASSIPMDPATLFGRDADVGMITPDSYLTKPVDIPEFLARVARLLGQSGPASR